jgi:hypothetical protein
MSGDAGMGMPGIPDSIYTIIVTVLTAVATLFTATAKLPGFKKGLGKVAEDTAKGQQSESALRFRIEVLERENAEMRSTAVEIRGNLRDISRLITNIREKSIRSEERQRSDAERINRLEEDMDDLADRFNRKFDSTHQGQHYGREGSTFRRRDRQNDDDHYRDRDRDEDEDEHEGASGSPLSGFEKGDWMSPT